MKSFFIFFLLPTLLYALPMQNHQTSIEFFKTLNKNNLELVDGFYAEDVSFVDPIGQVQGRAALKSYYEMMYENVTEIDFSFDKSHEVDEHVYLHWTMTFKSSKIKKGKDIQVEGMSYLRFNSDGQVDFHRDSFDMGAMLYEHIPILGYFTKKIKQRLEHSSK